MDLNKREKVILITMVIILVIINIVGYIKQERWKRQYSMIIEELAIKVSINSATIEDLESLPGIGPALARRIFSYRQQYGVFTSFDGLKKVKGIGDKKLAKILPYITLD